MTVDDLIDAHRRIVNDSDHPDWLTLFDWHRLEANPDKTRAAFEAIAREVERGRRAKEEA